MSDPAPSTPSPSTPAAPFAVGEVVFDLVVKRSARVTRVLPDALELSDGTTWRVAGPYLELLCRIPSPSLQELALDAPNEIAAGLRALAPADRILALLRGRRLGLTHRLAARPISGAALAQEHDAFLKEGGAAAVEAARRSLADHPEVSLGEDGEFTLRALSSGPLQDQFLAASALEDVEEEDYGREFRLSFLTSVSPLTTREHAQDDRAESESIVLWLVSENVRLLANEGLDPIERTRRGSLRDRLVSTVARHIVRKLYRVEGSKKRRWRKPEALVERVVQRLLEGLAERLGEAPPESPAPTALAALTLRLRAAPDVAAKPYPSQLLHTAVDQVVDRYFAKPRYNELEDAPLDARDTTAAREQSFSGTPGRRRTFRDPAERLGAAEAKALEVLGEELSQARRFVSEEWASLTSAPPDAEPSPQDLSGALEVLVEALRTSLIARLSEKPRWRRTFLLFLSTPAHSLATCKGKLTERCPKCGATPEEGKHRNANPGTLSSYISRELPPFLAQALPEQLRPYVSQGRALLPLLRAAHAIFPTDVWTYAQSERERVLLHQLLFSWGREQQDKRGRGVTKEFVEGLAIGAAAPAGGDWAGDPLLPRADLPLFVEDVVIPFVERVLEGRRTLPAQRRAASTLAAPTWQDLLPILDLILFGPPNAARLDAALRDRSEAEVARATGLTRLALYDLRAGRAFAPHDVARGLEAALALPPEALSGLIRPPLPSEFRVLLSEDELR